jgi:hypothetical protein
MMGTKIATYDYLSVLLPTQGLTYHEWRLRKTLLSAIIWNSKLPPFCSRAGQKFQDFCAISCTDFTMFYFPCIKQGTVYAWRNFTEVQTRETKRWNIKAYYFYTATGMRTCVGARGSRFQQYPRQKEKKHGTLEMWPTKKCFLMSAVNVQIPDKPNGYYSFFRHSCYNEHNHELDN